MKSMSECGFPFVRLHAPWFPDASPASTFPALPRTVRRIIAMVLTAHDGTVSGLQRSIRVTGGGDGSTTSSQISLFTLDGKRVRLNTSQPAMIADGDAVRIVGEDKPGEFVAIACLNRTTGWASPVPRYGCFIVPLLVFILVTLAIATVPVLIGSLLQIGLLPEAAGILLSLPALIATAMLIFLLRTAARHKRAHAMLHWGTPPPLLR